MNKIVFGFVILAVAVAGFVLLKQSDPAPLVDNQNENVSSAMTTDTNNASDLTSKDKTMIDENEPTVSLPKTEAEWKKILTPEQFKVTRKHGTERAFSGEYWDSKKEGTYVCVCCGLPLFASDTKYKSGTGWPSFWRALSKENIGTKKDRTLFSVRTEVHCSRCEAHIGHVFSDGPEPTGLRYCMNSAAMRLNEKSNSPETIIDPTATGTSKPESDSDK